MQIKSKKRIINIFAKNQGFTLIEVLIAASLLLIIMSGIIHLIVNTIKAQKHYEIKANFANIYNDLLKLTNDSDMCSSNFYNVSLQKPTNVDTYTEIFGNGSNKIQTIYDGYKYDTTNKIDHTYPTWLTTPPVIVSHGVPINGILVTSIKIKLPASKSAQKIIEIIDPDTGVSTTYTKWNASLIISAEKELPNDSLGYSKIRDRKIDFSILTNNAGKIYQCYEGNVSTELLAEFCFSLGGDYNINEKPKCSLKHLNVGEHQANEGIAYYNDLGTEIFRISRNELHYNHSFSITPPSMSVGNFNGSSSYLNYGNFQVDSNNTQISNGNVAQTLQVNGCISVGGGPCNGDICIAGNCRSTFETDDCEDGIFRGIQTSGVITCSSKRLCDEGEHYKGILPNGDVQCEENIHHNCPTGTYMTNITPGTPTNTFECKTIEENVDFGCNLQGQYISGVSGNNVTCTDDKHIINAMCGGAGGLFFKGVAENNQVFCEGSRSASAIPTTGAGGVSSPLHGDEETWHHYDLNCATTTGYTNSFLIGAYGHSSIADASLHPHYYLCVASVDCARFVININY